MIQYGQKGAGLPAKGVPMGLAIDLIFLCIVGATVGVGAKKGVVKTVLDIVAVVLAVVLAGALAAPFAEGVYDALLEDPVRERVEEALPESGEAAASVQQVLEGLPEFVTDYLAQSGFDVDALTERVSESTRTEDAVQQIADSVARPVCVAALKAILFLMLGVVLLAVFQILADLVSKLFKVPVVRTLNAGLGAALGAVKGLFLVVLFSIFLLVLSPHIGGEFSEMVSDSYTVEQVERLLPEGLAAII